MVSEPLLHAVACGCGHITTYYEGQPKPPFCETCGDSTRLRDFPIKHTPRREG